MSRLNVEINYMKIAQWFKSIQYLERKIMDELDRAAKKKGHNPPDRRFFSDRRKSGGEK